MERRRKIIRITDHCVNILILMCLVPMLVYAGYAIWDSMQVNVQADASRYERFRPTDDDLSFDELRKLNPEVFGWLTVYGTHIDYPLVQGDDNTKYVNTDVKGEFSLSGSLFLDCRNHNDFSDVNSVIYGHHMEKKAMFGEVEYFYQKEYFEEHRYGEIYYGEKWHGIDFFALLHVDAFDSVLYNTGYQDEEGRKIYLDYIRKNAKHFRELNFQQGEHYVALSTCTSSSTNGRHVLVGRITETPEKDSFIRQTDSKKK